MGGLDFITVHALLHGSPNATGYFLFYFNGMQAYSPTFTCDGGGVGIAKFRYPILGPKMGINAGCDANMSINDGELRIYAACCSPDWTEIKRL